MHLSILQQSQTLLVVATVLNIAAIIHIARRGEDGFRIRLLILVSYLIDNLLSGIVHVFRLSRSRGFYEALAGSPPGAGTGLLTASWAGLIGLVALYVGLLPRARHTHGRQEVGEDQLVSWASSRRLSALMVAGVLLVVCGASWVKVRNVTAGGGRIIAVGGGNARYVTLAGWLQWGVTLAALALLSRRAQTSSRIWNGLVMLFALGLIAVTGAWSGGRSTLLFSCLPLLAIVLPFTGRVKYPMLGVGGLALGGFVWYQTLERASKSAGSTDVFGLVDWQWGRFSMGAWAARYVDVHGSLHGETFYSMLIAVPNAFLHFAGMELPFHLRTMVQISGESFLGSNELIYIVPGLTAELIMNFGLVGILVGYLVLGRLAGFLADRFQNSIFEMERVLIAFIATTVVFSTIVAAAEAFFLGIVMDGLPLFGLVAWERIQHHRRQSARVPAD